MKTPSPQRVHPLTAAELTLHQEVQLHSRYHIVSGSTNPKIQGHSSFPQIIVQGLPRRALGTTYFQGVVLDGFPIFVTVNNGQVVLEPDLDELG